MKRVGPNYVDEDFNDGLCCIGVNVIRRHPLMVIVLRADGVRIPMRMLSVCDLIEFVGDMNPRTVCLDGEIVDREALEQLRYSPDGMPPGGGLH